LSVVLSTGTVKEGVFEMSNRLLKEYGEKTLVTEKDPKRLVKELRIPETKALQLVACFELGRRFYERNENGPAIIRNAKDVFEYLRELRTLSKEHVRGIYLDTHHKVIHDEVISIGTINANLIHPREVFAPAIHYGAVGIILAHNHPSGNVTPSKADVMVTKQLVEAGRIIGIPILDHVVIGKDSFKSIENNYSQ